MATSSKFPLVGVGITAGGSVEAYFASDGVHVRLSFPLDHPGEGDE